MQETLGKHVMYVKVECTLFAPLRNKIVTILIIAMLKMVKQHQRKYKTKQENNRTY